MSDKLSDSVLPAGAYIIRNKKVPAVLHIKNLDLSKEGSDIIASQQDEGQHRDQQVWWVEPLANYVCGTNELDKGPVYSITSPGTRWSLDTNIKTANMFAWKSLGGAGQRWRLKKVTDANDGVAFYNIISVFDDKVVDIIVDKVGKNPSLGARVHTWESIPEYSLQQWEFVIPVVSFPPGWFHMQNVGTGDLLRHDYVYNSPTLSPPPDSPKESQYREHWEFQWTLVHSKWFNSLTSGERNSWHITNRLTGTHLDRYLGNPEKADCLGPERFTWKLELDKLCNWKITNRGTSCLLQQTNLTHGSGPKAVATCDSQKFIKEGGNQSWILRYFHTIVIRLKTSYFLLIRRYSDYNRPPLLCTDDTSLPKYEA